MCIVNATPVKLTGPKKVYKVLLLVRDKDGNDTIHSPYRTFQTWRIGEKRSEINSEGAVRQALRIHYKDWSTVNELHGGAFHTFIEKEEADREKNLLLSLSNYIEHVALVFIHTKATRVGLVVGECTIPQDSEYVFEGDFEAFYAMENGEYKSVNSRSMASSELILDRIFEDEVERAVYL